MVSNWFRMESLEPWIGVLECKWFWTDFKPTSYEFLYFCSCLNSKNSNSDFLESKLESSDSESKFLESEWLLKRLQSSNLIFGIVSYFRSLNQTYQSPKELEEVFVKFLEGKDSNSESENSY